VGIKYDRRTPSGKNQPRSNKAGALLNDFFRLGALDENVERRVIYLTDGEMASYFRNPHNGLVGLFDLAQSAQFAIDGSLLAPLAKSVKDKIKVPIFPCYAVGDFARSLSRQHELRVYEVHVVN
jgi:hypothetical protein